MRCSRNLPLLFSERACYLFSMRLAFFDSGIGGLTVLKHAFEALPKDEFIYYADTRHAPYGVKSATEVRTCVLEAAEFLAQHSVDALVVACNTATAVAIQALRARFDFPIIGMEPAVKPALACNAGKRVLVLATSLTLKASKLDTLIANLDTNHKVERRELDGLVTFAENFEFDTSRVQDYLREKLAHLQWETYESIVLGCTHFVFYREALQRLAGKRIHVLDGNAGTVNHLIRTLAPLRPPLAAPRPPLPPRVTFYASGTPETPERVNRFNALLMIGQ